MRREVREETGLKVEKYDCRGIVTFVSDIAEVEYMHLFTIQETSGELITCDEGNLEWVPKERMIELPHWEGDTIFLGLIAGNFPFFSLKLVYQGDRLIDAVLNERKVLLSERLILRPWFAEDADALSAFISDPETGPPAGWPALPGAEVSGLMIQEALSLPGMKLLGSTDTILPYAESYATFILLAAPGFTSSCVMNNILRYEGKAFYAMLGLTAGGVLNIFGDWYFMYVFHMGIAGAGLSTCLSQYVSMIILLLPFLRGVVQSRFSLKYFTKDMTGTRLPRTPKFSAYYWGQVTRRRSRSGHPPPDRVDRVRRDP